MAETLTLRRLRQSSAIRELTRECRISSEQFLQPYFVVEGIQEKKSIPGFTDVYRETPDTLLKQVEKDLETGSRKALLFGVPAEKHQNAFDFHFTARQIESLRKHFGRDLFIAVDVCLCSFTTHGHCGILTLEGDHVDNPHSVKSLAQAALAYAQAGADCVAPSDMMDGRVRAIREALQGASLDRTLIMSYSAKFHSRFYGPFRLAADSAPKGEGTIFLEDRASYQIDPSRPTDAWASSLRDAGEGADILMVKPGLPYLDILYKLSKEIKKPWAVYEVSGEYAAIETLATQGLIHGPLAHLEVWTAFVRAGASMIISYGARHAKEWIERL